MKKNILNKAVELFLHYGFKSITMDDIANDLGISKKTIYKYFNRKTDLIEASTILVHEQVEQMIGETVKKDFNAIEENFVIKSIFKDMFKNVKTSPMFQLKKYYPETYSKLMTQQMSIFSEYVRDNLHKGIKEDLYRPDIEVETVMRFYFQLINGAYDGELYGTDMKDIMKTEVKILEYHTRSIATSKGVKVLEEQLINTINT
jgi:AcrR family transcriptional regulator